MSRIDELKAEILSHVVEAFDISSGDVDRLAARSARSMEVFADGDKAICLSDWKAWNNACIDEGRTISPSEFKATRRKVSDVMG
jgi:hypothetical protein